VTGKPSTTSVCGEPAALPPIVAETVFTPPTEDVMPNAAWPLELVVTELPGESVLPDSETASAMETPGTALPYWSSAVAVAVVEVVLSLGISEGLRLSVVEARTGVPGTNVALVETLTELPDAVTFTVWAVVVDRVAVSVPSEPVAPDDGDVVSEGEVPEAEKANPAPDTTLP
jgi:hypothetical protein